MALYRRDPQSGEHVVTHEGRMMRFPTRAAALRAVHDLLDRANDMRRHPSHRGG